MLLFGGGWERGNSSDLAKSLSLKYCCWNALILGKGNLSRLQSGADCASVWKRAFQVRDGISEPEPGQGRKAAVSGESLGPGQGWGTAASHHLRVSAVASVRGQKAWEVFGFPRMSGKIGQPCAEGWFARSGWLQVWEEAQRGKTPAIRATDCLALQ